MGTAIYYLVVAGGKDAGARVRIEEAQLVVGRARDVDLVLLDPRVSRHHLRARLEGDVARLETCEGATPFTMGGTPKTEAILRVGVDDHGAASGSVASGLVYQTASKRLSGTMRCP